jgi:hypothetical protein
MSIPSSLRFEILAANRKHPNIFKASKVVKDRPFISQPFISAFWESVLIALPVELKIQLPPQTYLEILPLLFLVYL